MRDCCVAHSAAMIRKSLIDEHHIQYEQFYSPAEDYRLWARLMEYTKFHNIQRVIVKYRDHYQRTSIKQKQRMAAGHRAVVIELQNRFPAYYREMIHSSTANVTVFRLRLFGKIPLIKIKNNRIWLFDVLPVLKIKWR